MPNGRDNRNEKYLINKEVLLSIWFCKKQIYKIPIDVNGKNRKEAEKKAKKGRDERINNKIKDFLEENVIKDNINNSLLLTKLIPVISIREDNCQKNELIDKKNFLNAIINKDSQNNPKFPINNGNIELKGFDKVLDNKTIATSSRLICGLGSANVLETAITLHHLYGIPYIPGSSLKGVCREVAFHWLAKNIREDKLNEFQNKFYGELYPDDEDILTYQLLFGAQNFKGLLLFLDAYPENNQQIFDLDIMNPHYSKYYSDKSGTVAPGDWESPVPIFFLTVKKGVKFKFNVLFDSWRWEKIKKDGINFKKDKKTIIIRFHDKDFKKECKDNECVFFINTQKVKNHIGNNDFYKDIITQALGFNGIGSKRCLGYGIFSVSDKA